jgi:hypothetical protein
MNHTDLCFLALWHRSDKVPVLGHSYTPFYHSLFGDRRDAVKKVLEIGIGFPETMPIANYKVGASLYMWRDYFPNAEIYGADIREDILINEGRIHSYKVNQGQSTELFALIDNIGQGFDLIVDDGSHKTDHQIISAIALAKYTDCYVIEDVQEPTKVKRAIEEYGYECEIHQFDKAKVDDCLVVVT